MYGVPKVGISRYLVLYVAQIGWAVLGLWLLSQAVWPSTCQPTTVIKFVTCSVHLPDNRGWAEASLMTWLWATPMLIGLEISRRLNPPKRK